MNSAASQIKMEVRFRKPWRGFFQSPLREAADLRQLPLFYSRRNLFTKSSLVLVITISSVLASFFSHVALVFTISYVLFLVNLFLTLKRTAYSVRWTMQAFDRAHSKQKLLVRVKFEGLSEPGWEQAFLTAQFTGSRSPQASVLWSPAEQKTQKSWINLEFDCDGGTGPHQIGQSELVLTDLFGFFEFEISSPQVLRVLIFPEFVQIPELQVRGRNDSLRYGMYDSDQRGISVNFSGVRDYSREDSLRYIAWKPSVRHQKLMVKEFERNVNSELTLWLDLALRNQAGDRRDSTWETVKSYALGVASQHLRIGNQVQLITQGLWVPYGLGEDYIYELARRLVEHEVDIQSQKRSILDYASELSPGTTVVFIAPIFKNSLGELTEIMNRLLIMEVVPICILLDAASFVMESPFRPTYNRRDLESWVRELSLRGVRVYWHRSGDAIGSPLLAGQAPRFHG